MSKETKLKPCPFCGNKAKLYQNDNGFHVQCTMCANGTFPSDLKRTVVFKWNRRANDE